MHALASDTKTPLLGKSNALVGAGEEVMHRTSSAPEPASNFKGGNMQSLIRQLITAGILSFVALVTTAEAQSDAATTYKAKCALCHSADGSADSQIGKSLHAKDLRSEEVQKKSDAELADVITKGNGAMPAFGATLSPEDVHKLVDYVRDLAKKK
jgi:mono/diheme cytochrome c family protein